MLFVLCNAPTTFQRCMMEIFYDIVEKFIEVLMDDFFVFGSYFDFCLVNLSKCRKNVNKPILYLIGRNFISWYGKELSLITKFMKKGIELDRAKVEIIENIFLH